jgi:hypothetical protein
MPIGQVFSSRLTVFLTEIVALQNPFSLDTLVNLATAAGVTG